MPEGGTPGRVPPESSDTTAEITHELLIRRARHWLENTAGAKVVLTEFAGGSVGGTRRAHRSNKEIPDAIGWLRSGVSLLIECKASRGDFLSDASKPSRSSRPGAKAGLRTDPGPGSLGPAFDPPPKTQGLGAYRFYLTPRGLVQPEELPKGWGLLELSLSSGASSGTKVTRSTAPPEGSHGAGRTRETQGVRYTISRAHDPLGVFDPRTKRLRKGLPDTRTRGTLQKENGLVLSALRLVQLRDLHGQELAPSRSVHQNLGHPGAG